MEAVLHPSSACIDAPLREALTAAVDALSRVDTSRVQCDEVHDALRFLRQVRVRVDAAITMLVARRAELLGLGENIGRGLAGDAGMSGREAKVATADATALSKVPTCARAAFSAGEISGEHLRALASGGAELDEATKVALLDEAKTLGADAFRRRVHEAATAADGDGSARHRRQHTSREGSVVEDDDGMTALRARFAPEAGAVVRNAIDRALDELWRAEHPTRSPSLAERPSYGARLADALVHICRRYLEPRAARGAGPGRSVPLLSVTADIQALREGLHAASRCHDHWGTPLAPETVRRLACDADIVPMVFGTASVPLDVGRSRRWPTAGQRLAVIVRDRHCRFPSCDSPPSWCDVHHVIHWTRGGPTDLDNLALLCGRHHHLVHEGGWRAFGNANERLRFTTPHGRDVGSTVPGRPRYRKVNCG